MAMVMGVSDQVSCSTSVARSPTARPAACSRTPPSSRPTSGARHDRHLEATALSTAEAASAHRVHPITVERCSRSRTCTRATARCRCSHGLDFHIGDGEIVVDPRRQRCGQDDDHAGDLRHGHDARIGPARRGAARRTTPRADRAPRCRARAAGPRHLPRADGAGEPRGRCVPPPRSTRRPGATWTAGATCSRCSVSGALNAPVSCQAASSRCSRSHARLMSRPRLLLLDEPSLGLAPLIIRELFEQLDRLNEEDGTTMLIVEQNASLALAIADRGIRDRSRSPRALRHGRRTVGQRLGAQGVPRILRVKEH